MPFAFILIKTPLRETKKSSAMIFGKDVRGGGREGVMCTFHGQQKVEITHHEKSDKPLYGSLIAKSKKFTVHGV